MKDFKQKYDEAFNLLVEYNVHAKSPVSYMLLHSDFSALANIKEFFVKNKKKIKKNHCFRDKKYSFIYYHTIEYDDGTFSCNCPSYKNEQLLRINIDKIKHIAENGKYKEYYQDKFKEELESASISPIQCSHILRILNPPLEYKINDLISLKLIDGETIVFIKNIEFIQCRYLLMNNPQENPKQKEIDSIDEAKVYLSHEMHEVVPKVFEITPEQEFWGHCSNIEAWVDYDYDTRILSSDIGFPMLKKLMEYGDDKAKKVFKDEIYLRIQSGFLPTIRFLIEEEYLTLKYFSEEELNHLEELIPKILIPELLQKRIETSSYSLQHTNM